MILEVKIRILASRKNRLRIGPARKKTGDDPQKTFMIWIQPILSNLYIETVLKPCYLYTSRKVRWTDRILPNQKNDLDPTIF